MMIKRAGLCITPEIVGAKTRYRLPDTVDITVLTNIAAERVRPMVRNIIAGHILNSVLCNG